MPLRPASGTQRSACNTAAPACTTPPPAAGPAKTPLVFAAGDANLSRYVGNHATGATDPSGMAEAVGHHWTPVTVTGAFFNSISKEAHDFFAGGYSGLMWKPHRNDTYGGVKHVDYNEMVKEELKEFMRVNGITDKKPMTAKQAHKFSANIRKAENLSDPARAANIKKFNDAIVADLRSKLLPDQGIDAAIARGKSYIEKNPKRYKAYIAIGATFYFISMKTAGAAETGAKTVVVLDELSKPGGLYEQLLRAAEKGDLAAVEMLLTGGGGNEVDPKSKSHVFGFFASAFVDDDRRVMYFVPVAHFEFVKWVSAYLTQDKYGGPPVEKRSSWWLSTWWPF